MVVNLKSKSFWWGFALNLIFWFTTNLIDKASKPGIMCFDCDKGFGKPFRVYESSSYCCPAYIAWQGVILNLLVVILSGIVLGLVFDFVCNKILAKSEKLD